MAQPTLLQLRTRARQRANMENSTFVTDAEFNSYINEAIADLRDKMISKVGADYFASTQSYTLINGTENYALPNDFYKVLYVEQQGIDQLYYKMRRFEVSERSLGASPISYYAPEIKYRLTANNITFTPVNQLGGILVRLTYVPVPTELSADIDTLNGYNGWETYPILLAARKALAKEESNVSDIDTELQMLIQRIESMADNRDYGNPYRIQDNTYKRYGRWGF
jgi:hypothetical protein